MVKEFWSELLTRASWEKLVELAGKYDFILIGGWAAFLWTKAHKSKDIDVVVDYPTLGLMRNEFNVVKNDRLRKYEIRFDKFDVDIYLPFYSQLGLPAESLREYSAVVEGIKTVKPEALLILKQQAEIARRGTPKGQKDAIDIMTLLLYSGIEFGHYRQLLEKHGKKSFLKELEHVIRNYGEKDLPFLGIGFNEFKKWRKKHWKS